MVKVVAAVALAISAAAAESTDYALLKDVVVALDSGHMVHAGGIMSTEWRWACMQNVRIKMQDNFDKITDKTQDLHC